jgi:hypothetical protein
VDLQQQRGRNAAEKCQREQHAGEAKRHQVPEAEESYRFPEVVGLERALHLLGKAQFPQATFPVRVNHNRSTVS